MTDFCTSVNSTSKAHSHSVPERHVELVQERIDNNPTVDGAFITTCYSVCLLCGRGLNYS